MPKKNPKPSFLQVMISAICAAFGVQNRKNQQRDFESGKIGHYIAAGILVTIIFIALVATVVNIVLNSAS
tara:strand:+ start:1699 stop:1908 length:210 start_codon:yes stop_codon:yes gene_type:complete